MSQEINSDPIDNLGVLISSSYEYG